MSNIYNTLPNNFTALAPMEGVTDVVFRQVVAHAARPHLFYTEFTNVHSFASEKGRSNALERLEIAPTDAPIIAQIWGTRPEHFAFTAANLPEGFAGIDINMGCPERHVVATGGGSALIRTPDLAAQIISAVKSSTTLPVSVKTRLGYTRIEEWRPWLTHLLKQDLAALTIHLRTKKEMSKVPAHHELIPEIIALRDELAPQTTLTLNGDFLQGQTLYKAPRLGTMIGRGIFADPFAFEQTPREHSREELIALLRYHLDVFDAQNAKTPLKFDPLKRFFKIYINNFPGASDLREKLMQTTTTDQVRSLLP